MATGVGSWSATAADNATADSNINWAENQAPSTVNNSARAMMAAHKVLETAGGWISHTDYTLTYVSSNSGTIAADVTGNNDFPVGRRIMVAGATTGTVYGYVASATYGAPNTTLVFTLDSSSIRNETLTLYYSRLSPKAVGAYDLGVAGALTVSGTASVGGALTPSGGIAGVTTSSNATSGHIGEYVSSTRASSSTINLTTNVNADVTSISLGAGDWDVWGHTVFGGPGATTLTTLVTFVNTTSATSTNALGSRGTFTYNGTQILSLEPVVHVGPTRMSLNATTTAYLIAGAAFSGGTCSAFGIIHARRRR